MNNECKYVAVPEPQEIVSRNLSGTIQGNEALYTLYKHYYEVQGWAEYQASSYVSDQEELDKYYEEYTLGKH